MKPNQEQPYQREITHQLVRLAQKCKPETLDANSLLRVISELNETSADGIESGHTRLALTIVRAMFRTKEVSILSVNSDGVCARVDPDPPEVIEAKPKAGERYFAYKPAPMHDSLEIFLRFENPE